MLSPFRVDATAGLVPLQSGYCLRRQYLVFAGVHYGKAVRDLLDRLVARRFFEASAEDCAKSRVRLWVGLDQVCRTVVTGFTRCDVRRRARAVAGRVVHRAELVRARRAKAVRRSMRPCSAASARTRSVPKTGNRRFAASRRPSRSSMSSASAESSSANAIAARSPSPEPQFVRCRHRLRHLHCQPVRPVRQPAADRLRRVLVGSSARTTGGTSTRP